MCTRIANHFFQTNPCSPLTSLKKCMNEPAAENNKAQIDKIKHIAVYFISVVITIVDSIDIKSVGFSIWILHSGLSI